MILTKEILINHSLLYHKEHIVKDIDVERANLLKNLIEWSRDSEVPTPGDIIICKGPKAHYNNGHLERWDVTEHSAICVRPSVPFAFETNLKVSFDTSGGYWFSVPDESFLEYVGTRVKMFKAFGHCGACGNGAYYFPAIVNVWEVFLETIY